MLHGGDTIGLFSVGCLEPAPFLSVPFALCRTLRRHGLHEGVFLTSVGTRVRPYRTLGERPVALHPRSYRTLGCVPCEGVAWYHRRRREMSMCPARKTAWQYLCLHCKGLDIDDKSVTKHMTYTGTVHSGPASGYVSLQMSDEPEDVLMGTCLGTDVDVVLWMHGWPMPGCRTSGDVVSGRPL